MKPIIAAPLIAIVLGGASVVGGVLEAKWLDDVLAQQGELTVTPSSGPVGTTVLLEGQGCNNPGQPTIIVFENSPASETATPGSDGIPNIPTDEQRRFRTTYVIPAAFQQGSLQGSGGGPVQPGVYEFTSKPPLCLANFTLTASGLPGTGSEPPVSGHTIPPLLTAAGIILILGLALVAATARRGLKR